jgi:hypothetical protein
MSLEVLTLIGPIQTTGLKWPNHFLVKSLEVIEHPCKNNQTLFSFFLVFFYYWNKKKKKKKKKKKVKRYFSPCNTVNPTPITCSSFLSSSIIQCLFSFVISTIIILKPFIYIIDIHHHHHSPSSSSSTRSPWTPCVPSYSSSFSTYKTTKLVEAHAKSCTNGGNGELNEEYLPRVWTWLGKVGTPSAGRWVG